MIDRDPPKPPIEAMAGFAPGDWFVAKTIHVETLAWSPEHDTLSPGIVEPDRETAFYKRSGPESPAFVRHRISWLDSIGVRHWVQYDVEIEDGIRRDAYYQERRDVNVSAFSA
jgi:hypothetical protein